MYKFTVFTIIFSVITIFVVAQLIITDFREPNTSATPSPSAIASATPEVKIPVDIPNFSQEKQLTDSFWTKIGLTENDIAFREYTDRIFSILPTQSLGTIKTYKNFIKTGNLAGTELYEIILADTESAEKQYSDMHKLAETSILFTINTTNDFGDQSFYLNDEQKSEFVFLIVLKKNVIYAFAYKKEVHSLMIPLLKTLP